MERFERNSLPTAWRGVASPRYVRLARWLSLVEELGGTRADLIGGPGRPDAFWTVPRPKPTRGERSVLPVTPTRDRLDEVLQFVDHELSRAQRLVLMLFYAEDLSFDEVADVLDLPKATVRRLHRDAVATIEEQFG